MKNNLTLASKLLSKRYPIEQLNKYFIDLSEYYKDKEIQIPIKLYDDKRPFYSSSNSKLFFSAICSYVAYINFAANYSSSLIFGGIAAFFFSSQLFDFSIYNNRVRTIYFSFEKESECSVIKSSEDNKIPVLLISVYTYRGLIDVRLDQMKRIELKNNDLIMVYEENEKENKLIISKENFIGTELIEESRV